MTTQLARTRYEELNAVIGRGLQSFVNTGNALREMRDDGIYAVEYDTFDAYCRAQCDLGRQRAYELIAGARVVENLIVRNCVQIPANEAQARPLTKLEPEEQPVVWELAVEKAGDGNITAAIVEEAVAETLDDPPSVEVHIKKSKDPRSQLLRDAARPIREAKKLSPAGFEEGEMNVLLKIIRRLIKRLEHVDGDHPTT